MLRRAAASLFLSGCLMTSLLGACGGKPKPADDTASAAKAEPAAPEVANPQAPEPAGPIKTPPSAPSADAKHPEAAALCRSALACAADCFREAGAPAQSIPECAQPRSPECIAALKEARPPALEMTMIGLRCALPCEKDNRTLEDLQGVVPEQWAKLDVKERGVWTGIIAGRDCVPGSKCEEVCDADYPAPETVQKRGKQAEANAKANAQREAASK